MHSDTQKDHGVLTSAPFFSRNVPATPDPLVNRDHLLEAISQAISAESPIVFLEGSDGCGVSTLLAQFSLRFPDNTFSLFIRPASRFAFSPDYLRLVLAEQYWWYLNGTRLDEQFVDISMFETLQLRVRKTARGRPIYITVDGMSQISSEDARAVEAIFKEVLPIGIDAFRFIISGSQREMERFAPSIHSKSYQVARFSDPESEHVLSGLPIEEESKHQLLKLCRGNPGRLSSVRRLVASGVSAEAILDSAPDKYLTFIGLEFKPISSLNETQKLLMATLTYSRHSLTASELLELVRAASQTDLDVLLKLFSFIEIDDSTSSLNFLSEAHRRFSESALAPFRQSALSLQIDHLVRNPESLNALRLLPTYLQSLNRLDAIIELISKDHYSQLLDATHSVSALRARAAIGARSAFQLNQAQAIFGFSLQRSIFSTIGSPEQLQSEVAALVALGKPSLALDIAAKTPTHEQRISLLAEFARQSRERGLSVDAQVVAYIKELAAGIDFSGFGQAAVALAENILFVDPDLAISIVDVALKGEASALTRDQAFVNLTMAASFSKDPDKGEIDKIPTAKIGNEALQKLVQSICSIAGEFSFEEVVRMVDGMAIGRKIYLLRTLVSIKASQANVLDVVDYTLDQLIRNTTYTPKARDLSDLAKALTMTKGNSERVRQLIKRIEAQMGLLEPTSPTGDLVVLQMRLAHSEYAFDAEKARKRIEEIYYDVAVNQNLEIQTICLSLMSKTMELMGQGISDAVLTELHDVVIQDLKLAVSSLLSHTANHYQIANPTLVALAASQPDEAIAFVPSLNTEDRRDRAYSAIASAIVRGAWSKARATFVHECISSIKSSHASQTAALGVLEAAAGSNSSLDWIGDAERVSMRITSNCLICVGEIVLVNYHTKHKLFDRIEGRVNRFVENVRSIDSLYKRIDSYFSMSAAVATSNVARATELYEAGAAERAATVISSESGAEVLQTCLSLTLRCFSPLIRTSAFLDDHLDRFARICDQIPCSLTRAYLYSDLACRAWCEGRRDLTNRIVGDYCRPLLEDARARNTALHGELCAVMFPAIHCAHAQSAFAIFDQAPEHLRASMVFTTALMVLRQSPPSEPWSGLEEESTKIRHEALLDIIDLLRRAPTDATFYSVVSLAVKTVSHKVNRTTVSAQQRADFANRLEEIIEEKLPDVRNIRHLGFKVVSLAQSMRLTERKRLEWERLISDALAVPNLADRSYVMLEVADCLPKQMSDVRTKLLNDAKDLARLIPAACDRYSNLETFIRITRRLDPSAAKNALREALLLTFESGLADVSTINRRSLVDIAETISPAVLDELAEMIDDDPARATAKADLKRSVEVHKLRKKLSAVDANVDTVSLQSASLPSAAWKNVEALQANRLVPQKPETLASYVDAAGALSIQRAYPVFAWYVENASRRFRTESDVNSFIAPLCEKVLLSAEIASSVLSKGPNRTTFASVGGHNDDNKPEAFIAGPGERSAALDFIGRWLRDFGVGCITVSDPYFSQADMVLLRLVLANCPQCSVRVLTSRKAVSNANKVFDAESFLMEWNDLVEQEPPQTEIVAMAWNESHVGPVHDRWILTSLGGLRLGTSFNSIGGDKLSEISALNASEALAVLVRIEPFFGRQRIVDGARVTYQSVSF